MGGWHVPRIGLALALTACAVIGITSSATADESDGPVGRPPDKRSAGDSVAAGADGVATVEVLYEEGVDDAAVAALVIGLGGAVRGEVPGFLTLAEVPAERVIDVQSSPLVAAVRPPTRNPGVALPESPAGGELSARTQLAGEHVLSMEAVAWHAAGHTGAGVKIGILDKFDVGTWVAAQEAGELPAPAGTFCLDAGADCGFGVLSGATHGVNVAEVIHDLAPDAELYVAEWGTLADLDDALDWLAEQGVDVINRSERLWFDYGLAAGRGDGPFAQQVEDLIEEHDIAFFNGAGNEGARGNDPPQYARHSWRDADSDTHGEFDLGGGEYSEWIPALCLGLYLHVALRWSDWAAPEEVTDFDLTVTNASNVTVASSTSPQGDPSAMLNSAAESVTTPCVPLATYRVRVSWYSASNPTDAPPGGDTLELTLANSAGFVEGYTSAYTASIDDIAANPSVIAVGAVEADHQIATYSSEGPTNAGVMKPDLSARTDITTYTTTSTEDDPFNGTSAASPAAAGAAALALGAGVASNHVELRQWLIDHATVDRGEAGPDNLYGHGELRLPVPPGPDLTGTAWFRSQAPTRIFDSRPDHGAPGPKGYVPDGGTVDVQVTGGAIPAEAMAVVMNVTVTEPGGPGYVSVYPTGTQRPTASSVNLTESGQTRAALVTVPLGADGKVTIFSRGGAHVIADVAGVFVPNTDAAALTGGRFEAITPARLFDTRSADPNGGPAGMIGGRQSVDVTVLGRAGVPASGVSAVVLNLTGTEASQAGYLTVFPTGTAVPTASNVNLNGSGATAPNLAVVPLGTDGRISVYSSHGAHAIGDVVGYITGDSAPRSSTGLFVPLAPSRVFDTRPDQAAPGPKGYVPAEGSVDARVAGVAGVPAEASAVVLSVAGVESGLGYLTVWNTGVDRPVASTINFSGLPDTRANGAWQQVGTDGRVSFFSKGGTHVIADVSGYFVE